MSAANRSRRSLASLGGFSARDLLDGDELLQPGQWTQYVPVISESSSLAIISVLVHGWVLLVLSAALIAGIAPRASAAVASVLMLEIVIALMATGLSDTALRDVGVLGLAVALTGATHQRLVLRD